MLENKSFATALKKVKTNCRQIDIKDIQDRMQGLVNSYITIPYIWPGPDLYHVLNSA